jgi:hypothetical protein
VWYAVLFPNRPSGALLCVPSVLVLVSGFSGFAEIVAS